MRNLYSNTGVVSLADLLVALATFLLRYGLVVIILWFGAFKFTEAEAVAIEPLIRSSPFLSWLYAWADPVRVSGLLGATEITIALLIALRPLSATLSGVGSVGAIGMFITTLSFLITTPGMFVSVEGFLVPSEAGAFIIKDIFLLGAALLTGAEALAASRIVPRLTFATVFPRTIQRVRMGKA